MVHIPFDTRSIGYDDFIIQYGGGILPGENELLTEKYNYFRGINPYQRGYGYQTGGGIGDILRGFWRIMLPFVRKAGTSIGREALSTGERILDKIAQGENLKQTVISEGKKGVDTLLEKHGVPKQFGSGAIKRRRKKQPKLIHQTIIGKPVIKDPSKNHKRKRIDTFGLY